GLIEATGRAHGLSGLVQGTFGVTDGNTLWAVRYASEGTARTLFASNDIDALQRLYPENARLARLSHDDRVIVSEPVIDLPGAWEEIPQASAAIVRYGGAMELRPFHPRIASAPATADA